MNHERPVLKQPFGLLLRRALRLRCPACGEGQPFPSWFKLRERCRVCGFAHAREPGYFLGSIYLNYGLTGALVLVWVAFAAFVLELDEGLQFALPIGFIVVFPLWFLRYARALWMAIDLALDPPGADEFKTDEIRPD